MKIFFFNFHYFVIPAVFFFLHSLPMSFSQIFQNEAIIFKIINHVNILKIDFIGNLRWNLQKAVSSHWFNEIIENWNIP